MSRNSARNAYGSRWCFAIVLIVILPQLQACVSQSGPLFYEVTEPNLKMRTIGTPVVVRDFTACVYHCRQTYRSCYSFIYNEKTKTCSTGSWLSSDFGLSPTSNSETLYSLKELPLCEISEGFTLTQYLDVTACISTNFSDGAVVYQKAKSICTSKGSQVVTVRLQEKLRILQSIFSTQNGHYWVGLTDMDSDGIFTWSGGASMTQQQKGYIFKDGEPNNLGGIEHCVFLLNFDLTQGLDIPCDSAAYRYFAICEKKDPELLYRARVPGQA